MGLTPSRELVTDAHQSLPFISRAPPEYVYGGTEEGESSAAAAPATNSGKGAAKSAPTPPPAKKGKGAHRNTELTYYYEHRVLPLTKDFFPSPESPLFQQLWSARRHQNPRYHFQSEDTWSPGAFLDPTACYSSLEVLAQQAMLETADLRGAAAAPADPKDPTREELLRSLKEMQDKLEGRDVPFASRGELYDLFVTQTEQSVLFHTTEELRQAAAAVHPFDGTGDTAGGTTETAAQQQQLPRPLPSVVLLVRTRIPADVRAKIYFAAGIQRHHRSGNNNFAVNNKQRLGIFHDMRDLVVTPTDVLEGLAAWARRHPPGAEAGAEGEEVDWIPVPLQERTNNLATQVEVRVVGAFGCWTVQEVLQRSLFLSRASSPPQQQQQQQEEAMQSVTARAEPHGVPSRTLVPIAFFDKYVGDKEMCHTFFSLCREFARGLRECLYPDTKVVQAASSMLSSDILNSAKFATAAKQEHAQRNNHRKGSAPAVEEAAEAAAAPTEEMDARWLAWAEAANTKLMASKDGSGGGGLSLSFFTRFSNVPQLQLCRQIRLMLREMQAMFPSPPTLNDFQESQRKRNNAVLEARSAAAAAAAAAAADGSEGSGAHPPPPPAPEANKAKEVAAAEVVPPPTTAAAAAAAPVGARRRPTLSIDQIIPAKLAEVPPNAPDSLREDDEGLRCYIDEGVVVLYVHQDAVLRALCQLAYMPLGDSVEALGVTLTAAAPPMLTYRGEVRRPELVPTPLRGSPTHASDAAVLDCYMNGIRFAPEPGLPRVPLRTGRADRGGHEAMEYVSLTGAAAHQIGVLPRHLLERQQGNYIPTSCPAERAAEQSQEVYSVPSCWAGWTLQELLDASTSCPHAGDQTPDSVMGYSPLARHRRRGSANVALEGLAAASLPLHITAETPQRVLRGGDILRCRVEAGERPEDSCAVWYVDEQLHPEDVVLSWMRRVGGRARDTRAMETKWVRYPAALCERLRRYVRPPTGDSEDENLQRVMLEIVRCRRFRQWRFSHDGFVYFHGVTVRMPGILPSPRKGDKKHVDAVRSSGEGISLAAYTLPAALAPPAATGNTAAATPPPGAEETKATLAKKEEAMATTTIANPAPATAAAAAPAEVVAAAVPRPQVESTAPPSSNTSTRLAVPLPRSAAGGAPERQPYPQRPPLASAAGGGGGGGYGGAVFGHATMPPPQPSPYANMAAAPMGMPMAPYAMAGNYAPAGPYTMDWGTNPSGNYSNAFYPNYTSHMSHHNPNMNPNLYGGGMPNNYGPPPPPPSAAPPLQQPYTATTPAPSTALTPQPHTTASLARVAETSASSMGPYMMGPKVHDSFFGSQHNVSTGALNESNSHSRSPTAAAGTSPAGLARPPSMPHLSSLHSITAEGSQLRVRVLTKQRSARAGTPPLAEAPPPPAVEANYGATGVSPGGVEEGEAPPPPLLHKHSSRQGGRMSHNPYSFTNTIVDHGGSNLTAAAVNGSNRSLQRISAAAATTAQSNFYAADGPTAQTPLYGASGGSYYGMARTDSVEAAAARDLYPRYSPTADHPVDTTAPSPQQQQRQQLQQPQGYDSSHNYYYSMGNENGAAGAAGGPQQYMDPNGSRPGSFYNNA